MANENIVGWSLWGSWTCSVTCGLGTESRHIRCIYGSSCGGNSEERKACNKQICPGELFLYLTMFTLCDTVK